MKPIHLLAPALAIVGSGYWLYHQNDTIRELTKKTKVIRERIVVVEKAVSQTPVVLGSAKDEKEDEFTLPDGSLDWEAISKLIAEMQNSQGMPTNMKAMLKLQARMMELTGEELMAGLDKLPTLDLPADTVKMMKQSLLSQLAEKDPLAALEALGDPATSRSDDLFWTQSQIIGSVARKHPTKAIAWLDQQITDEKLESTSLNQDEDPRLLLERALISQLFTSDFTAARNRLDLFNEDEKVYLLTNHHRQLKGEDARDFLKLSREILPPEKASEVITQSFGNQYRSSLAEISEAVNDLPFSQQEREGVVQSMVANYARNTESDSRFKEIYEWSRNESPGQEAALVSSALSSDHNQWQDPQASFQKALTVAEDLGDEAIASEYVSKLSRQGNPDHVADQLEKFTDSDLAAKYQALVDTLPQPSTDSE